MGSNITGAQDNVVANTSKVTLVSSTSVADVTAFPPGAAPGRTSQQTVLPNTVDQRLLGNIITSSASGLGNGSFIKATISAGTSTSFLFTLSDNQGRTIIAVPDVAVFIDKITAANQWPNAIYGMGSMPVTVFNDWGLTDNVNVATRCVVRNNFAADVVVFVVCRWRIITNATVSLQQADADSGQTLSEASGFIGGMGSGGL